MNYTITSLYPKKAVLLLVLSVFSIMSLLIIFVNHDNFGEMSYGLFGIGIFLCLVCSALITLRFSKKQSVLFLSDKHLELDGTIIQLSDIQGYYLNKEAALMSQLEFRDAVRSYSITSFNYGQAGKTFDNFLADFLSKPMGTMAAPVELTYFDFHPKQFTFTKLFIPIFLIVLIVIDILYIYLVVMHKVSLSWKFFFVNSLFIGQMVFYKKNKPKENKNAGN